jgi:hypothetical protein
VYNYDRRGRGESGDTPPYAVEREIEDIEAVIGAAGGRTFLYGSSSGAVLALEAARSGLPVVKLAMWEPPYSPDENARRPPADTAQVFARLVAEGRRGDAVEHFMSKVVGMPDEFVTQARSAPWWPWQEGLAHTLAYDATIMGDYLIPVERVSTVTAPTLVLAGGASFGPLIESAKKLADILPNGEYRELPGQTHDVAGEVLAPARTLTPEPGRVGFGRTRPGSPTERRVAHEYNRDRQPAPAERRLTSLRGPSARVERVVLRGHKQAGPRRRQAPPPLRRDLRHPRRRHRSDRRRRAADGIERAYRGDPG